MINYTTPTISLTVEDIDLTGKDVYVTLEQGCNQLTKKGSQLAISIEEGDTVINLTLTQEESGRFDFNRNASVQVNWISSDGVRSATEIKKIDVMRNLLDEVIEYGN